MKRLLFIIIAIITFFSIGCRDEFAKLNTSPTDIDKANVPFLFSQGILSFNPNEYSLWFYNGRYMAHLMQAFCPTGGYSDYEGIITPDMGGQGSKLRSVLIYARELDYLIDAMGQEGKQYLQLRAILSPLIVFLGIMDSDVYGSRPYSEACFGRYGGTLTPKYDTMEELYDEFLAELDYAMDLFNNPPVAQTLPTNADIIYRCDINKWKKFTNSLRLKIAVRLLHQNKAKAFQIAHQVATDPAGIISPAEDMLYNKGPNDYGVGVPLDRYTAIVQPICSYMVKNVDPRVRFVSGKNGYNSKIVQGFFDAEARHSEKSGHLPQFILDLVNYHLEGERKVFDSWKWPGEPFVRYFGLPAKIVSDVTGDDQYLINSQYRVLYMPKKDGTDSTVNRSYVPYSIWQEEQVRGLVDYSVPVLPGSPAIIDNTDWPWYFFHFSSAEVNLYFAELKLLGADLPRTAEQYYIDGVTQSVTVYDRLAGLNHIPYYDNTYGYDPNEKTINLKQGEIETMMTQSDYSFTGTPEEKLEKVYLQQYIHFMLFSTEQFVSVRRSAVPKINSPLLAWSQFKGVPESRIPRRLEINPLNVSSLMYEIEKKSFAEQGFTPGAGVGDPSVLNRERVWIDKGAPQYGAGPNILPQ